MDKKAVILSLFLIATLIGHTVAIPILIPVIAGVVVGGIAGYYLGSWFAQDNSEERVAQLEAQLTESQSINDELIRMSLKEEEGSIRMFVYETEDFINYSKNYAWALVKYKVWEAKTQGKSVSECWDMVNQSLKEFYKNQTINLVTTHNTLAKGVALKLNKWHELGLSTLLGDGDKFIKIMAIGTDGNPYEGIYGGVDFGNGLEVGWIDEYNQVTNPWVDFTTENMTISVAGLDYNLTVFRNAYVDTAACVAYPSTSGTELIRGIYVFTNGTWEKVYDFDLFYNALNEVNETYYQMVSNAEQYVSDVYVYNISTEEVIDPYVLASFLNQNINETGYYGYYAAEMALLGLPTNVTTPITIQINGTNYTGFLFTNIPQLNVSETYTVPGESYFITENGTFMVLPAGTNFTVLDIVNPKTGEHLNSTSLQIYVTHSGDVTKIAEELEKLYDLYEKVLEMSTTTGGGGSLSDWWASLDQTTKLLIIGVGIVMLVLLTRK